MDITEISPNKWEQTIQSIGSDNYFQSVQWLDIVAKNFKLTNVYYEIRENNACYFLSLQKDTQGDGFSPFIGYGGVLSAAKLSFELNQKIIIAIEKTTQKKILRMKLYPFTQYADSPNTNFSEQTTAVLPIQKTVEAQEALFHKKTRTAVRSAQKKGVTVRSLIVTDIPDFYALYLETAKRVKSEYITPQAFFADVVTLEHVKFLGAFYQQRLIGGSVFFCSKHGIFYWWNASGEQGKQLNANYAILFEAITQAINDSMTFLDMASSHSPQIENSKLRWGSYLKPVYTWQKS